MLLPEMVKSVWIFDKSIWKNNLILKKTFKYSDGVKIELGDRMIESPILIFYPSGEISGGEIEIYYEKYIHRLVIKNNGEIKNEVINY